MANPFGSYTYAPYAQEQGDKATTPVDFRPSYDKNALKRIIKSYKKNPRAFNKEQIESIKQHAIFHNTAFFEGDFSIMQALGQFGTGLVEGFAVFSPLDAGVPDNEYESLARNIGHLIGFAPGLLSKPLKLLGMPRKAAAIAGIKSYPMKGGEFVTKKAAKYIDPIIDNVIKRRVSDTGLVSKFITSGGVKSVAEEALKLGVASSISNIKQGIPGMVEAARSGGEMGAAFQLLGNLVPGSSKFAYLGRAIAGSIYQGSHATIRGLSTPEQIYEYILGAYFGGGAAGWRKKAVQNFLKEKNEQTFGEDGKVADGELYATNDVTKVKSWSKLDPIIQKDILKHFRSPKKEDGTVNPDYDPIIEGDIESRRALQNELRLQLNIEPDKPEMTKEGWKKFAEHTKKIKEGKPDTGLAERTEKEFNDLYNEKKELAEKINKLNIKLSESKGKERMEAQSDIDKINERFQEIEKREADLRTLEPYQYYRKDKKGFEEIVTEDRLDDGNDIGMISKADMLRKSEKFVMDNLSELWDKPEFDSIAKNNEVIRLTNVIDNIIRQPKYYEIGSEKKVDVTELANEIRTELSNKENFTLSELPEKTVNDLRQFLTRKNFEYPVKYINATADYSGNIETFRERGENQYTNAGNRKLISEPKKETQKVLEELTGRKDVNANVILDNVTIRGDRGEFVDLTLNKYKKYLQEENGFKEGLDAYNEFLSQSHQEMGKKGYYPFGGKGDNDLLIYIAKHPNLKNADALKSVTDYVDSFTGKGYKYFDAALRNNKHFTRKEAKEQYISNIMWDLSLNGYKPKTPAEYKTYLNRLFKGEGYIKNATAWNKRQQIWFTPTYRADKTFLTNDYDNYLSRLKAEEMFKLPVEFIDATENNKARYIIAKDLKDDLFVKDKYGKPTKIRIKPLTTNSKNTEHGEHVDGQILVEDGFLNSMIKDSGMPPESGQSKSFIVSPDNTNGALLGKYMMHSVGETASKQMREAGIHMIMQESAVKQRGERKITDYDIKNDKLIIDDAKAIYELPFEHIKYNYNVKQDNTMAGYTNPDNPHGTAHYHRIPKQFLMHMAQNVHKAFPQRLIEDFMNETVYKKYNGKADINETYLEFKKYPDSKVLLRKLEKNIEDLGMEYLTEAINGEPNNFTDIAYMRLMKINKDLIAERVAEGEISREDGQHLEKNIDDFNSPNDRMIKAAIEWSNREKRLGRPGNINPVIVHKYNRDFAYQVIRNYVFQSISKPKIENSGVARMRGYDKWFQKDSKFKDLETNDEVFYLDDAFRYMPLKTAIKGYKETTLEKLFEAYETFEGREKQMADNALTALTVRVPMDSVSGAQRMRFGGFTGRKGHGILLHSRAMRAEGGADLDGDEAFIFFGGREGSQGGGFRRSWMDAFHANKGEYYKEDGTTFNNKNKEAEKNLAIQDSIKKTGIDPEARDSKYWQYDSQWRQDISQRAVEGRNLLGGAVTMSQVLKATHNSILNMPNKSVVFSLPDGQSVRLEAKTDPKQLRKARELASSMVAFTSDPLDVAGLKGYNHFFTQLSRAYFKIKAFDAKGKEMTVKDKDMNSIISNFGPYAQMKDINSALYSRDYANNRSYDALSIKFLTDSVNNMQFLGQEAARNSMLPKLGKLANEIDLYDSVFRKINFDRLGKMYDEHAELIKTMPELKATLSNLRVVQHPLVDLIRKTPIWEMGEIQKYAANKELYNKIIEAKGSPYRKGSKLREGKDKRYDESLANMSAEYRAGKLKELLRFVEDTITNDVTDMVTMRQAFRLYDPVEIGPTLFKKILRHADALKRNSYLQRNTNLATTEIDGISINKKLYQDIVSGLADIPKIDFIDKSATLNQAEIDQLILNTKKTYPNKRAEKLLDTFLLGSIKPDTKKTNTSKLGISSSAVEGKSLVDFLGEYSYIMNKSYKNSYKADKETKESFDKGDMMEKDGPDVTGIFKDTTTGFEGLFEKPGKGKIPKEQKQVITELVGRIKNYNNIVGRDINLIARKVVQKDFNAMTFADIVRLNEYFKNVQKGTWFQSFWDAKVLGVDDPGLRQRYYWQFPEAVGRETMRHDVRRFRERGLFYDKMGRVVEGDMLKLTSIQDKLYHAINTSLDKAESKAEEKVIELRKSLEYLDSIEDGESLRALGVRKIETLNANKRLSEDPGLNRYLTELYIKPYENLLKEIDFEAKANKLYRVNVREGDTFKRAELTGQQIVDKVVQDYKNFFDGMYKIVKGDKDLLDRYHVVKQGKKQYWDAKDFKDFKRDKPSEPIYAYRQFVKDIHSEYQKGRDITTAFGIDGLRAIARSMMIQLQHRYKAKSREQLRKEMPIPEETGRIEDGYWPHMFFDKSVVKKSMTEAIKRVEDSNLSDTEKAEQISKIVFRHKSLTGDWLTGTENWDSYEKLIDPMQPQKKSEKFAWFEANQMTSNMHKRVSHIPGWSIDGTVAETYARNTMKVYYKQLSQILARDILVDFDSRAIDKGWHKIDVQNGRSLKDRWLDYYKLYVQDAMGNPTIIPDYIINDPGMKLKGTPYAWWADNKVTEKVNKIADKLGIKSFAKDAKPFNVQDVMHWSNLEAKYQLMSLLAHPKSAIYNIFGGTLHTIQSAGATNLRKVYDYRYLKTINPKFDNRQALTEFAVSQGVFPEMLMHDFGMQREFQSKKAKQFVEAIGKKLGPDGQLKDTTVRELAAEYGIGRRLTDIAAKFMSVPEMRLRVDSFIAHYIQAYNRFGGAILQYDHPFLIEMAKKGVKATQFLYNAPSRPAFARTSLGKILTRFQLWGWNATKFRNDVIREARVRGYEAGTPEYNKFKRLAEIDLLVYSLGSIFAMSLFDSTIPAPLNHFKDTTEWLFGDEKTRSKAFWGTYPTALAPLQIITPPIARTPIAILKALGSGDFDKFLDYHMYMMFPFGRIARDISPWAKGNIFDNPYRMVEKFTGLPYSDLSKMRKQLRENTAYHPSYGGVARFGMVPED